MRNLSILSEIQYLFVYYQQFVVPLPQRISMMSVNQEMVKRYVRYLKLQRNMSGNTLDAYQRDLQKLLDYLKGEGKDPREVQLEDLEKRVLALERMDR